MLALVVVDSGNHDLCQRLTHLDVDLAAQCQNHARNLLCHRHAGLEVDVDTLLVGLGEALQVNRLQLAAEVVVELIGIEGSERCEQTGHRGEAGVERLIGGALVGAHLLTPETLAVEAHIPVAQVVVDETVDEAAGARRVVVVELSGHTLDERVEAGEYPAVNLGEADLAVAERGGVGVEAVDVGVEREETVGVVECTEKLTAALIHTVGVELQVIPRLRVGEHVEAHGVGAIFVDHLEWVGDVAHMLRHLVALGIEHETGGDDVLEGYRTEHHRGDGVEREEPAARLVDALVDEVGGEEGWRNGRTLVGAVNQLTAVFGLALAGGFQTLGINLALEGVVQLGVGHGAGVEPHVDEVALAVHGLAVVAHEHDAVDVRAVQVNLVVVFLREVAHHEALVLEGVRRHEAGLDSFLDLIVELLDGADALLVAVLVAPDGQRRTPEA